MTITTLEIRNNTAANRYEATVEGHLVQIDYILHGNVVSFTHTGVPAALEGRGLASQLAKFVLEEAKAKGYQVRPLCPFIKSYIEKHPEYQALL